MAKTDLTEEEKKRIIEALNNNIELPPELMTKLFPGLAEKFDVAKLDRAKIVTLEYAGKRNLKKIRGRYYCNQAIDGSAEKKRERE